MRRQRRNYSRIFVIGIGLSALAHVALFGLGHFTLETRNAPESSLNVMSLPEPDRAEVEHPEVQPLDGADFAVAVEVGPLADRAPDPASELAEYQLVLAEAAGSDLTRPLIPQPRITPAHVETSLSPLRVREPALLTLGRDGARGGGRGVGIDILVGVGVGGLRGGDNCTPSAINIRYPNSRIPRSPSVHLPGLRIGTRR